MTNYEQVNDSTQIFKTYIFENVGIGGAGVAIGASGVGNISYSNQCSIHQKIRKRCI